MQKSTSKSGIETRSVKETFEQQVELQRVKIGDLQSIGHQRTGAGTASRANRHAVILRPLDKLHHNQEVAREPHLVDNLQLDVQTFVVLRSTLCALFRIRKQKRQTLFQTLFRFHDQKSSVVISPVGNCGRKYSPSRTVTLQRLAISTLFASASGMSANSSHISSSLRIYCCGE